MAQLAHLPDLCLLLIFDRVPICDLLRHIMLVSLRWSHLARSALARRRQLRINTVSRFSIGWPLSVYRITPQKPLLNYLPLQSSMQPISGEHYHKAVGPFQQVRSVCMAMYYDREREASPPFRALLTHFGPRLVKLHLGRVQTIQLRPALFELISQTNLPQLRNLTFHVNDTCFDRQPEYFAFPIIRQLRKCHFDLHGISLEDLQRAVFQYVEQANELINCELGILTPRNVNSLLQVGAIVAQSITKYECLYGAPDIPTLRNLCAHLSNQTEIHFYNRLNFSLSDLFGCFQQLAQLNSLYVDLAPLDNYQFAGQLTSVRHLRLCVALTSHLHLFESGLQLGATFPQLESLIIQYTPNRCTLCQFGRNQNDEVRNCFQQLINALMSDDRLTNLNHVIVKQIIGDEQVEWSKL